ncbi:MAG: GDSL-type esterase/lipase family protein [Myxococcota bacterium]
MNTRSTSLLVAFGLVLGACSSSASEASTSQPPPSTEPEAAPAESAPTPEPSPPAAVAEAPAKPATPAKPAWTPRPEDDITPHHALENPEALAYFYDQLAALDDGDARVVRVVHLGASMIGMDDLPSILRGKFQTRFGDGGAGLVLLQRYMTNYIHRWVSLKGKGWEQCYIGYLCKGDGFYGLGGATFWSRGGAKTTIATRDDALGGEVSHFDVWYAGSKGGGRLKVTVDGQEPVVLETKADALENRYHAIDVEKGPHRITVQPGGGGTARAFGVVLETDQGLVWDQFSWLGAFTKRMHAWNDAHIADQVKHRDPALLVFTFGGNDTRRMANKKLTGAQYTAEFVKGIEKVKAGKPEASCLVTAMTDRSRSLDFDVTAVLDDVVEAQRQAAVQSGCAFFDSFTAMGGKGSLAAWRKKRPSLAAPDRKHLNHAGREVLGGWMYDAIVAGYVAHRRAAK